MWGMCRRLPGGVFESGLVQKAPVFINYIIITGRVKIALTTKLTSIKEYEEEIK